jgi:hypothetical protein
VDAVGGAEKVDAVKNLKITAQISMVSPRGEMQVKSSSLYVLPDRIRQEMVTPMGTMAMVVTPAEAFMNTPMGVQAMRDSQKADLVKGLNRELVVLMQKRADADFSVTYAGSDDVDGVKAEMIVVTHKGETVRYSMDPASGRILKAAYKGTGPGGVPGERTSRYSDFREVAGLSVPFKSEILFNGEPAGSMVVEEITVNVPVDESTFVKPVAAAAAGAPSGGR